GAHGQAVAQVRLGVGRGDGGDHDLGRDALVAQAQGLLEGDLVEGVGRQLDAVGDHAGTVRPDLDADVGVHHALVGDQDLHRWGLPSKKTAASSGWTANSSESGGWPAWAWAILPGCSIPSSSAVAAARGCGRCRATTCPSSSWR